MSKNKRAQTNQGPLVFRHSCHDRPYGPPRVLSRSDFATAKRWSHCKNCDPTRAPFDRDPDTYAIIGAAMAVHSELGCGYLEAVYKTALRIEFRRHSIEFWPEVSLPIDYKGERLPMNYRVDFVCGQVLVEVKALSMLAPVHESQVINYLKASGLKRGLLLNFGTVSLQHRRIVWKYETPPSR